MEQQYNEEEIDLMDYVRVILKRKVFILALFLIVIIAAGIFSFLSPKTYKIDTILEIGKVGEKMVETPEQLIGRIEGDVYGVLIRAKLNIPEAEYPIIKTENPKDTSIIKIKIESKDINLSRKVLDEKNELIIADHQEKIELEKEILNKKIETTEENIKILEKDIERVEIKITSLEQEQKNLEAKVGALEKVLIYQQDPGTQFALFDAKERLEAKKQEIENRYLDIGALKNQINDLELQIDSLKKQMKNVQPTSIIKTPTVSEEPIRPRPFLNMAIAGILGLFVGVFGAFSREWWQNSAR